jgi:ribosomal protein S13
MVRLYLIKTFRGRCFALGKPSRGQRTWSNAANANHCNKVIRLFIGQVKKINIVEKKTKSLNVKFIKKKIKKTAPKMKMVITKKKKNLWF